MNLDKFKLLNEDESHYEIAHPNGKKLKVEKKGLNSKAHDLIAKLKPHYDEGGEVQPEIPSFLAASGPAYQGPPVISNAAPGSEPTAMPTPADISNINSGTNVGGFNKDIVPQNMNNLTSSDSAGFIPSQNQQSQPQSADELIKQKGMGVSDALKQQQDFMQRQADAESMYGKKEGAAIAQTQNKIDLMQSQADILRQYQQREPALMQDFMDKKIDPNRLWHQAGVGSKITASLGLILGGIGAGLTHGPNLAAQTIESLVNKDVDAQKADSDKALTRWKMNKDMLGSDLAANLATKNDLYTSLKFKLDKAQAESMGPIAQAKIGQAKSLLDQQIAANNQQMSFMQIGLGKTQGGSGYAGADPSALVKELVPEHARAKVADEIEAAQNTKRNATEIMKTFDEAVKEQSLFSKNAIPWVNSAKIGKLHAMLGPTFKDIDGTVRQAAMDNLYHAINPEILSGNQTNDDKRSALEHYLKYKSSAPNAKLYGIDLSKFETTAPPEIGATKSMNGVNYQKVDGGWKRVK